MKLQTKGVIACAASLAVVLAVGMIERTLHPPTREESACIGETFANFQYCIWHERMNEWLEPCCAATTLNHCWLRKHVGAI